MQRLRCGLLGLNGEGRGLLDAVVSNPALELVALGDPEHPGLRETAEQTGAKAFQDCRSLLVETSPEVVFVALPARLAGDYLRTAAEHAIGVFQLAPWAIDFEAAAGLADLFERSVCPHVIARSWQVERAYDRLRALHDLLGRVYAVGVDVIGSSRDRHGWRGDADWVGGGTLYHDAYEQIDMVVTLCGVPEQVYAAAGQITGPGGPRLHDTEDAMSVICNYSQDRFATVTSCRAEVAADWTVTMRGTAATARISPKSMRVTGPAGERISATRVRARNRYRPAVAAFATSLLEKTASIPSSSRDHLPTMAVMQAAYLSAKTGSPESPAAFLRITGGE